ncbi:hypothetical protein V2J09_023650 [Rumex salicifolius]
MEDTDDSLDDWRDLMMSPTGLLSGFTSEPCFSKSVSDVFCGGGSALGTDHMRELEVFMSNPEANFGEDEFRVGSVVGVDNALVNNGDMIMEKYGFHDASPLVSAGSRLPRLTIPSGMSPNELLDSPVMLSNSQIFSEQLKLSTDMIHRKPLSPTTGTMNFSPPENDDSMLKSTYSADREQDSDDVSSFHLKPPLPCYPPSQNQNFQTEDYCQSLLPIQPPSDYEFLVKQENPRLKSSGLELATDATTPFGISLMTESSAFQLSSHSYGVAETETRENNKTARGTDVLGAQSLDVGHKGLCTSVGTAKTSEDGYNWRKYGQKQVKGSDYPRSYYKCTHLSCLVKKKVERSHDGEITEIIYKGAHNHPKPQPSRRSTFGSTVACGEPIEIGEGSGSYVKADPLWRETQQGYKDTKVGSEWRSEGLDITSSTSVVTELSDPHSNNQKPVGPLESAETPELASTLASHDEEEDANTQGSLSVGEDDDMETESKRRKRESSLIESALGSRALREPRVIVQIESEIDIIDDGYRWRKYGQKVVKGNPNPRSYYKCTSAGCIVRKHVERASHNLKYVLTTYEGKHNHVVPAARNSNHMNSGNGNLPPSSSVSQSTLTLPRNSHIPKAEPQNFVPPFNRKMEYETEFLRPEYLGNFSGTPSSMYHHMKFPTVPSSGLYGAFGLNTNYSSSAPPMIPSVGNLSIPLPLNFPLPSSFAMVGYNHPGRSLDPVPPFFMDQQMKDCDVKLLRPKQEQ